MTESIPVESAFHRELSTAPECRVFGRVGPYVQSPAPAVAAVSQCPHRL
jgi:hypothetical protein